MNGGVNFRKIGSLLIEKYKEISMVKGVKIIFITDEKINYDSIEKLARRNYEITETLNHVMNNIIFVFKILIFFY